MSDALTDWTPARSDELEALAKIGTWQVDLVTGELTWSAQMRRLVSLEADAEPLSVEQYAACVDPGDRERVLGELGGLLTAGTAFDSEHRLVLDGGVRRVVRALGRADLDHAGLPCRAHGTTQDITEQVAVREQLAAKAALLDGVIANNPALIYVKDLDGRYLLYNEPFATAFDLNGRGKAEGLDGEVVLLGRDDRWLDERLQPIWRSNDLKAQDGPYVLEEFSDHPEHGRLTYDSSKFPLRDSTGATYATCGVSLETTDRRRAEQALRESELRHRLVLRHMPEATVTLLDTELRVILAEGQRSEALGLTTEALRGRPWIDIWPQPVTDQLKPAVERALAGSSSTVACHSPLDGSRHVIEAVPYRPEDAAIAGVVLLSRDVTVQHEVAQTARRAEERFSDAFHNAPIGMALVGLDGHFQDVNGALTRITGYTREQLLQLDFSAITHPDDVDDSREGLRALLQGEQAVFARDKRYIHATGHEVWVGVSATVTRGDDGKPAHLLAQMVDVTERRLFEDRLRHMADHDPLTGMANRRRFEAELERHVDQGRRYGFDGALLVLDIDHFKSINDTLGHSAGDDLIVSVAGVLQKQLRTSDTLARLGGDEFAVLLPRATRVQADLVADKIVRAVRDHAVQMSGRTHRVTVSLGVTLFKEASQGDAQDAIVDADLAMYDAKEAGRDRHAWFSSAEFSQARTKARLTWQQRINDAIEQDGFVLEAQPILDLRSGQVTQHELLLRMLGPSGELIPPATFLYIAERFGTVQLIDRWVARQAVALLAAAGDQPLTLEVNIFGHSLGDPELLASIEDDLAQTGVDPARLIFEVTETAAVADIARARTFAERLGSLGCRFALDDFGAGFGSLYYLKHLPFDFLKIDGEFVANCLSNRTDQLVIQSAVTLAAGLGKQTIAEFVGDAASQDLLCKLGVDYGQGFFIGKPAPLDSLTALQGSTSRARQDGETPPPAR